MKHNVIYAKNYGLYASFMAAIASITKDPDKAAYYASQAATYARRATEV